MLIKVVLKDRIVPPIPAPWKNLYPNGPTIPAVSNIAVYNETRRRDNIIKELVKECKFTEGEIALSAAANEEYIVHRICKCYAHMGADVEWPASDNPMIVTIIAVKDKTVSFCTTNYLKVKP